MQIKLTIHEAKGRYVVNTPGSHLQRQPRVFASIERAQERAEELQRAAPSARIFEVRK